MTTETTAKRVEKKYIIQNDVLKDLLKDLEPYLVADKYKHSTITNLYFDTDDYEIIRRSIAATNFKEKFRIRSYSPEPVLDSQVFMEIKSKNDGVVYKERFQTTLFSAINFLNGVEDIEDKAFADNMEIFMGKYPTMKPKMYIYYDRLSMKAKDSNKVRLTVDSNLTYRDINLDDLTNKSGKALLDSNYSIVEIKLNQEMPEWLEEVLENHQIEKGSFSKYGTAYKLTAGIVSE